MKRLFRVAMLVGMVTLFLSVWSLPTVGASGVAPANGQPNQGHFSLNVSSKGTLPPPPTSVVAASFPR